MRKKLFLILTLMMLLLFSANAAVFAAYDDVGDKHWAAVEIWQLSVRGVIAGFPDGSFKPGDELTRAQLAKMLVVALHREAQAEELRYFPSPFHDISVYNWAAGYINEAYELGLIMGYEDGTFRPNQKITRAEIAAMVMRSLDLYANVSDTGDTETTFADDDAIPYWSKGYVAAAQRQQLVKGFADNTFRPENNTTRAEAAVLLNRLLGKFGAVFDFSGKVVSVGNGGTRIYVYTGQQVVDFDLASDCVILKGQERVKSEDIQPDDDIVGILNRQGSVGYVEIEAGT